MLTLAVEKREKLGKGVRTLRKAGSLPAVVYGAHKKATPISLVQHSFEKLLRTTGESTVITLTGLGEEIPVLIQEIERHPVTGVPQHADFYAIEKGQKVKIKIPLEFTGESPAVRAETNLINVLHELEVEAGPMNLPPPFTIDIASLAAVGDQIHARDIVLPKDVVLVLSPDEVIALIQEVKEEKVEEVPVAVDMEAIEVEKKGKAEEEGGEGETPAQAPEKSEKKPKK